MGSCYHPMQSMGIAPWRPQAKANVSDSSNNQKKSKSYNMQSDPGHRAMHMTMKCRLYEFHSKAAEHGTHHSDPSANTLTFSQYAKRPPNVSFCCSIQPMQVPPGTRLVI